jgi:hypothetical protein
MYFEDIFFRIKRLWQQQYVLSYGNKAKTFIESLGADYDKIDSLVECQKSDYTEWESMMAFVMYQVLTKSGLELLEQNHNILTVDTISLEKFERKYRENLEYEGNEQYLASYKGLRVRAFQAK